VQTQVHNAQNLIGDSSAGDKGLRPVASPLEKEVRRPASKSRFLELHEQLNCWLAACLSRPRAVKLTRCLDSGNRPQLWLEESQ
jgi:hypothetical protein